MRDDSASRSLRRLPWAPRWRVRWSARPEVDDMTEADLGYADTVYEQVPCMIDGAARICIALKAAMERIETCRG